MFASLSTLSLVLHTTRATRREKRMLYLINGKRRELKLGKVKHITALPVVHVSACNCSNVGNKVSNLGN